MNNDYTHIRVTKEIRMKLKILAAQQGISMLEMLDKLMKEYK
tara:strand:- start:6774 stop:6899 length:126 start_codon:yes stop_codon:yes gene_type:complete